MKVTAEVFHPDAVLRAWWLEEYKSGRACPAPTPEHYDAVLYSAYIAKRLLHLPRTPIPLYAELGAERGGYTKSWYFELKMGLPCAVYVNRDSSVAQAVGTVLHESMHLTEEPYYVPRESFERRAQEFQRKWAQAVFRAGFDVEWDAARVHVLDLDPTQYIRAELPAEQGDTALSRKTSSAWRYLFGSWQRMTYS
jgi:hypothetical protein